MGHETLKARIASAPLVKGVVDRLVEKSIAGIFPMDEAATVLRHKHSLMDELVEKAAKLNESLFGRKIDFYGISYIADPCVNDCSYCGLSTSVPHRRQILSDEELRKDFAVVMDYGAGELCILAGEHPVVTPEFLSKAGRIALEMDGKKALEKLTFNVAPFDAEGFRKMRSGIDFPLQFRIFQESYDPVTYRLHHTKGPKRNMEFRLGAHSRALKAGFDHVGIGALLGLNADDSVYKHFGNDFEIMAMIDHGYRLHEGTGRFPHSMSIPRHQAVDGFAGKVANPVDDQRYILYNAILKLALPYTKLILTRRETAEMFDVLRPILNIEDLAPRPGVGGNYKAAHFQNVVPDSRNAKEIVADVAAKGYIPVIKM